MCPMRLYRLLPKSLEFSANYPVLSLRHHACLVPLSLPPPPRHPTLLSPPPVVTPSLPCYLCLQSPRPAPRAQAQASPCPPALSYPPTVAAPAKAQSPSSASDLLHSTCTDTLCSHLSQVRCVIHGAWNYFAQ
jgi:hypothetical protein